MTSRAREVLRQLIENSGKTQEECKLLGVLEELVENSPDFQNRYWDAHDDVLCALEDNSHLAARMFLVESLFPSD